MNKCCSFSCNLIKSTSVQNDNILAKSLEVYYSSNKISKWLLGQIYKHSKIIKKKYNNNNKWLKAKVISICQLKLLLVVI